MKLPLKSPVAAQELNTTYNVLFNLIHRRKIPAPQRDSSGDYLWSPADLERARKVLAERQSKKAARQARQTEGRIAP